MSDVDVRKEGYLRRLKTQRKRYFVLRTISLCGKPRLEYYESEKKFRSKSSPKRSIELASCLNIARKENAKHDYVFALYTREDAFGLVAETEEQLSSWLLAIQDEQTKSQQLLNNVAEWCVCVKPRGLGTSRKLAGQYNLRLTNHSLMLLQKDSQDVAMELDLTSIRRCGHTDCFFFMEVGRSASTGAGELWVQVEDRIIAQSMHDAIMRGMQRYAGPISATISPTRSKSFGDGKSKASRQRQRSLTASSENRGRCDSMPDSPRAFQKSSPRPGPHKRTKSFPRFLGSRKIRQERCPSTYGSHPRDKKSLSFSSIFGGNLSRAQSSIDFRSDLHDLQSHNISVPDSPTESRANEFLNVSPLHSIRTISESSGCLCDHTDDTSTPVNSLNVMITPAADNETPEYMNVAEPLLNENSDIDYYIAMDNKEANNLQVPEPYETMTVSREPREDLDSADSYVNIMALKLQEKTENKFKPDTSVETSGGYVTMVTAENEGTMDRIKKNRRRSGNPKQLSSDVRSGFLQQIKTSSKQITAPEINLLSQQNVTGSQQDVTRSQQDVREQVTIKSSFTSAVKSRLKTLKSTTQEGDQEVSVLNGTESWSSEQEDELQRHSYMNFTPGQFNAKERSVPRHIEAEYMNIDFERRGSNLERRDDSRHNYVNVDLRRNNSLPDGREYMNFIPGQILSETDAEENSAKEITQLEKEASPTKHENADKTDWLMVHFDSQNPEKNLNYISLDLTSSSGSNIVAVEPRAIPTETRLEEKSSGRSSYVEIDFTKSDGLKQVLQEKQELKGSAVET